jgi:small conductance mechanosensitive channel
MADQFVNLDTLQQVKQKVVDLSVEFGPRAVTAVLIMTVGFFVARSIGRLFARWLAKVHLEPPVQLLLLRVIRLMIFGMFLILALQNLGVQLLPLIAGLGVAGAGIALAMQGVLGNLAAGLTIIFTKPFRVGEYVQMVGVEGRVEIIELFSTKLSNPDRSQIVIPNRKIVGEILHNYGTIRQLSITVGVAYGTDLNAALATIHRVLEHNERVLKEPAPEVQVTLLADSSINIAVKPWAKVTDFGIVNGEVNKGIVEEFRACNISIPFPQREFRMLKEAS